MKFVVSLKLNVRLLCLFQLHTRKKKSNKNHNKMSCTEVKRYISRYLAAWVAKQDTAKSCPLSKPGQPNNLRFTLFRLSKFSTVTFSHHSPACHICNIPKRNYKQTTTRGHTIRSENQRIKVENIKPALNSTEKMHFQDSGRLQQKAHPQTSPTSNQNNSKKKIEKIESLQAKLW